MKLFWLGAASCLVSLIILTVIGLIAKLHYEINYPNPEHYTKSEAAANAARKLVEYTEAQHVPVHQFKGPYFKRHEGGEIETYTVCFKHPAHFFCYDDWMNYVNAYPKSPEDKVSDSTKWLDALSE